MSATNDGINRPTAAAPTARRPQSEIRALVASQTAIDLTVFHMFPFLAMELRAKIWKAMLPNARIVQLLYDVERDGEMRYTYLNGVEYYGTWRFHNSPFEIVNQRICQESRSEFLKSSGYEILQLKRDVTKRAWFYYAKDTLLFHTNAGLPKEGEEQALVLPPTYFPLMSKDMERVKTIAVSGGLWMDWNFLEDFGYLKFSQFVVFTTCYTLWSLEPVGGAITNVHSDDVSCEMCPGYGHDGTSQVWKNNFCRDLKADKVQLLLPSDPLQLNSTSFEFQRCENEAWEALMRASLGGFDCLVEVVDVL
ncbi:hypothetical protein IFR05_013890 [Cadophora sp. M221]|nr:hypothetical protein IFR05_013890 [Cadophora sp. M221]